MKTEKASLDPAKIFAQANAFYRAIDQLHRTSASGDHFARIMIPVSVLSAFASELFFNCLLCMEKGDFRRIHFLMDLFNSLSPGTQKRLEQLWAENAAQRAEVLDRLDKSRGEPLPRDLRSNLRLGTDGFNQLRYLYEGGNDFIYLLGDLPIVLRRALLEKQPSWANL